MSAAAQPGDGPLRLLLSAASAQRLAPAISAALGGQPHRLLAPGDAEAALVDIAFVSRDVTGLSTKHELEPATANFYNAMRGAAGLRWVHTHSAGADRPVFVELRERGVQVTTSSGANAAVVAQSTPAQFGQFIQKEYEKWKVIVRESGATAE